MQQRFFELTITFTPILIDFDSNDSHSFLSEIARLQHLVSRLQQIVRFSNAEDDTPASKLVYTVDTNNTNQRGSLPSPSPRRVRFPFTCLETGPFPENSTSILTVRNGEDVEPRPCRNGEDDVEPQLCRLVRKCVENKNGLVLCEEGVGGTYFVRDHSCQPLAVFKPIDEEPGAVNNPKKPLNHVLLPPGGGAHREVAAYLLDRNNAGVPETRLIFGIQHERMSYADGKIVPKNGSVQQFVPNLGNSATVGTSRYPVEDVHNIGILDVRLLNVDRNEENMLVLKQGDLYRLVPIDHTYILPYTLEDVYLGWMYWKQSKVPFSRETLNFIADISAEKDAQILRDLGISEQCIQYMMMSTVLLKRSAAAGLTLFQIASMVCRKKKSEKSDLEILVAQAGENISDEKILECLIDDFIRKKTAENVTKLHVTQ